MSNLLNTLLTGLSLPVDDGLTAHLQGMQLPNLSLASTGGEFVNLLETQQTLVLYIYPLTGRPEVALPVGWDEIPGARGCTPQACDFSNHYQTLMNLNAVVFGLSSQTTASQTELKHRLHLPFNLLSDSHFLLQSALKLPTFKVNEMMLYKRLTLIAERGIIHKVFYPVFPPNQHASQVISWLKSH